MNLKIQAAVAAVSLFVASSCDDMAKNQAKADELHAKANAKLTAVNDDAAAKLKTARAEADKKVAEARASFDKKREEYKASTSAALEDLDKKINDLEARAKKSKAKAKKELELKAKQLKEKRDAFSAEAKEIGDSSEQTWDETKVKLDKKWAELKALVD